MRKTTVKIGRFNIAPDCFLDIQTNRLGTSIIVTDAKNDRRYEIAINDDGKTTWRRVAVISATAPLPEPVPEVQEELTSEDWDRTQHQAAPARTRRLTARSPTKLRFTIQNSINSNKPRHVVWVHAAYRRHDALVVLGRQRWQSGVVDELIQVVGTSGHIRERRMQARDRVGHEDWDRLLTLPEGAPFRLNGIEWEKLPVSELNDLNGRVLKPVSEVVR